MVGIKVKVKTEVGVEVGGYGWKVKIKVRVRSRGRSRSGSGSRSENIKMDRYILPYMMRLRYLYGQLWDVLHVPYTRYQGTEGVQTIFRHLAFINLRTIIIAAGNSTGIYTRRFADHARHSPYVLHPTSTRSPEFPPFSCPLHKIPNSTSSRHPPSSLPCLAWAP